MNKFFKWLYIFLLNEGIMMIFMCLFILHLWANGDMADQQHHISKSWIFLNFIIIFAYGNVYSFVLSTLLFFKLSYRWITIINLIVTILLCMIVLDFHLDISFNRLIDNIIRNSMPLGVIILLQFNYQFLCQYFYRHISQFSVKPNSANLN